MKHQKIGKIMNTQFAENFAQNVVSSIAVLNQNLKESFDKEVYPKLMKIAKDNNSSFEISKNDIIFKKSVETNVLNEVKTIQKQLEVYFNLLESLSGSNISFSFDCSMFEKESNDKLVLISSKDGKKTIATLNTLNNDSAEKVKVSYNNCSCGYFEPNQLEKLLVVKNDQRVKKSNLKKFFDSLKWASFDTNTIGNYFIEEDMLQGFAITKSQIEQLRKENEFIKDWHDCVIRNKITGRLCFAQVNKSGITGDYGMGAIFEDGVYSFYGTKEDWDCILKLD